MAWFVVGALVFMSTVAMFFISTDKFHPRTRRMTQPPMAPAYQ